MRKVCSVHKDRIRAKQNVSFTSFFFFTTVLSHLDFSHGEFGLLSLEKASWDRVALPNLRCMLGALVFPYSTEL